MGITEQEATNLQTLDSAWASFCQMLDASGSSLERSKESFRDRLLRSIESTAKEITEARDKFLNHAPFNNVVRCILLKHTIESFRTVCRITIPPKNQDHMLLQVAQGLSGTPVNACLQGDAPLYRWALSTY